MNMESKQGVINSLMNYESKYPPVHDILNSTSTPLSQEILKVNDSGYSTGKSAEPDTPSYRHLRRESDRLYAFTPSYSPSNRFTSLASVNYSGLSPIPRLNFSCANDEIQIPGVAPFIIKEDSLKTPQFVRQKPRFRPVTVYRHGQDIGVPHIDFFKDLAQFSPAVSRIISYLNDKDLEACKKVSRKWCQIISEHLCHRPKISPLKSLEHGHLIKRSKAYDEIRDPLQYIEHNLLGVHISESDGLIRSRTKSDSSQDLGKHTQFVEAGKKLLRCESLRPCPKCSSPARITPIENRGRCNNLNCLNDFCSICTTKFHGITPCPVKTFTNGKLEVRNTQVCSEKSKKNLRRLLV